jgi:hypothetical protein
VRFADTAERHLRSDLLLHLTGFDTAGFVFFQVGVLTAVLLTRTPDKRQAETTSLYDEIRIWLNAEDVDPAAELRDILGELGVKDGKIGVEMDSHTHGRSSSGYRRADGIRCNEARRFRHAARRRPLQLWKL